MNQIRATVRIEGRVQGVSFRYHTRETARRLNVTGWVKNLPDGAVAAVFEGDETAVRQALDWCGRGPAAAQVSDLQVREEPARGEFGFFEIIH